MRSLVLCLVLWLVGAAAGVAAAEENRAAGIYRGVQRELTVSIPRLDAQVRVDGVLDEDAWQRAARLTDFSQYSPVDGRPAQHRTEVLVWYSPTAIHFGVRAYAPAGAVRATLADRDKIDADDQVLIFLGTFNDGRQALMFGVNPLGVQADGALAEGTRSTSSGLSGPTGEREAPDLSPDFVFQSKGRLTDYGYEVEIRIPFKSLRYQPRPQQNWGLNVVRRVQSTGHEDTWAPTSRSGASFLAQSGTLEGLKDLHRGLVLDLNPVVTTKIDGAPASQGWTYTGGTPEVGGNLRWGLTSNLTLDGTVNPDFSHIEADAQQFVFDPRVALFFPEKRPFFLEGLEQFATPNRLIYTRRIVAPLGAAKLTGKVAGTTLALLSAVDDTMSSVSGRDHPVFTIARVQRDLGGRSRVAAAYTDRIESSSYNRVASSDARLIFGDLYTLQLQGAASFTRRDGLDTRGPLWEAILNRNGRRFGARYQITGISEDFNAESGLISRAGVAEVRLDHRLTLFGPRGALVENWTGNVLLDGVWQYHRFVGGQGAQDRKLHINTNVRLRGGWRASGTGIFETFGFDDRLYAGYALERTGPGGREILPFTGVSDIGNLDWSLTLDTPQFSKLAGSAFVLWGRDENFFEWSPARILFTRLSADLRPTEQIRVNASYQIQQYRRESDRTIVGSRRNPRLKVEYQISRSTFFRVVAEYDARRQDDLRDDGRTDLPLLMRDATTGDYVPARAFDRHALRADWLFSYRPTPGTVVYAGYGGLLSEPLDRGVGRLRRTSDGFFLKMSYLFRM